MKTAEPQTRPPPRRRRLGVNAPPREIRWWPLLFFPTLGIVLEALHALKVGWYLNVSTATRRLLWTLAHAHGTLLAFVHIAFGLTVAERARAPYGIHFPDRGKHLVAGRIFRGRDYDLRRRSRPGNSAGALGAVLLFAAALLTARGASR